MALGDDRQHQVGLRHLVVEAASQEGGSERAFFCVEASDGHEAVELYFPDRASARQCARALAHEPGRAVSLSVWGRYAMRTGKPRDCWLYVWWNEAADRGELPDLGCGVPDDRTNPAPFEQLGPDRP